ncbi:Aste57867_21458 [Aphanomyces stellatus]|uniref:Aste57867_21458 protein n=1 Tax=Aphanomyces stellatus TaxID=120398 RepID=A0A485LI95_9STRA|nr:hypothetical protein As57867_021389 [Aphanomyces stellatus]VFT98129.1 Aste57867_21458 [Aphanomyces stellatus]
MTPSPRTLVCLRATMVVAYAIFLWRSAVHAVNADIRETSHRAPNLLTPADGSFAIWGVIYTWLLVFVVRECVRPSDALAPNIYVLYVLFIASCPCATLWMELFVAGYTGLAFVPIFVLWLVLFAAYLYVEDKIEPIVVTSILASTNADHAFASTARTDFWCIRVPFTLYWAWICAAATVQLNLTCEFYGLHAMWIYVFWCGMWVLANCVILIGTGDVPFACVALWTLLGIASASRERKELHATNLVQYGEHYAVEVMASVGAFVFAGLFVFLVIHKWWRGPPSRPRPAALLEQIPNASYGTAV